MHIDPSRKCRYDVKSVAFFFAAAERSLQIVQAASITVGGRPLLKVQSDHVFCIQLLREPFCSRLSASYPSPGSSFEMSPYEMWISMACSSCGSLVSALFPHGPTVVQCGLLSPCPKADSGTVPRNGINHHNPLITQKFPVLCCRC